MGKSNQALLAATEPCLILGPAVLGPNWERQRDLWTPDLDAFFVSYSSVCERLPDANGRMSQVGERPKAEFRRHWGTVICDEAHYLKGRKTKWTQAVSKLSTDNLFLLTGTPVPNWAHEIYMLLKLIGPEGVDLNSYWRWVERYFVTYTGPGGKGRKIGKKKREVPWERFVTDNRLDELMLRRTEQESWSDRPPLWGVDEDSFLPTDDGIIEVEMVPAQRRLYKELKKNYLAWTPSGEEVSAWSGGGLHTKLAQVSTGLEVLDPSSKGSGKLDMLEELVEDRPGMPLLIPCKFRGTVREVAGRLRAMGREVTTILGGDSRGSGEAAARFQAGEGDCLVATLDTISTGLDLYRASTVIFVERSWRPDVNKQTIKRLHRMGQEHPVTVITLETQGTVDANIGRALGDKTEQQMEMLSAQAFASML